MTPTDRAIYSPPDGLGGGDSALHSRLWSLWDMVTVYAKNIAQLAANISSLGDDRCPEGTTDDQTVLEGDHDKILAAFDHDLQLCGALGMPVSASVMRALQAKFAARDFTYQDSRSAFQNLFLVLKAELEPRALLYLAPNERALYEHGPFPFGSVVDAAFPSAREDISEAYKCMGLGRATATVYHLMCVAEVGLRVLAWDRRVKFFNSRGKPKKRVDLTLLDWVKILEALERAESQIEQFPATRARESQFAFYHGAMIQLRAFKNMFRNRTMHARERYDIHRALSALISVRTFMITLAEKVSERKRTPLRWGIAQLKTARTVNPSDVLAAATSGDQTSAPE
jgi:hypothetical protein